MLDASKYTSKDQMYMDQMLAQVVSHEHDNWLMLAGGNEYISSTELKVLAGRICMEGESVSSIPY